MQEKLPAVIAALCVLLFAVGFGLWFVQKQGDLFRTDPGTRDSSARISSRPESRDDSAFRKEAADARKAFEDALELEELNRILQDKHAIPNEAVLQFNSSDDYAKFLHLTGASDLDLLGQLPRYFAIRIGYDSLDDLHGALADFDPDDFGAFANYLVSIPSVPPEDEEEATQALVPFGPNSIRYLGVVDGVVPAEWGQGVRIAVLDSAVLAHQTFREGQVRIVDFEGRPEDFSSEDLGHGIAVASLIGGSAPNAAGLAPGAELLSYPVTGADGFSDSFTLAQAIFAAVDDGADIINISMGSFGDSSIVRQAVNHAVTNDVLIVAAAGNDNTSQISFPAALDGVVSVGAIDAASQHVYYSNTGDNLTVTAPGIGIYTAWTGNSVVAADGTSFSAPLFVGATGVVLGENPSLSPLEAAEELLLYTNEAGRPGSDEEYGNGILDLGRFLERFTPDIFDAAVASQTFENPVIPTNLANQMLDVAIQNVGTETLYNVKVEISSADTTYTHQISTLRPTEVATRQAPVDTFRTRLEGALRVTTRVTTPTMPVTDRNPGDNTQTTVIFIQDPGS